MPFPNTGTGGALASAIVQETAAGGPMYLTQRQKVLTAQWGFFRGQQYEHRQFEWDGTAARVMEQGVTIAPPLAIPPGFVDVKGQTSAVELRDRRPSAPYHIVRSIVERFTGLLFSARRHPIIRVPGDADTEDYLNALCEEGRLWSKMVTARNYGGAMGSTAVAFKLVDGRPVFEVFDPRWCYPKFLSRTEGTLRELEVRYVFPDYVEVYDKKTKRTELEERWFYFRRVMDTNSDLQWDRVPVTGQEPQWENIPHHKAHHNLRACPAVWIQNQEVQDDLDGDTDVHGCYQMVEAMDALIAQANRGILGNCDPTLVLTSDNDMADISKGTGNGIKLEKGGSASYLELQGGGPRAAREMAEDLEKKVCRQARIVLDQSSAVMKTATEIDRDYSAMLEKADVLREQYGERGVKRLLGIALRVCRSAMTPQLDPVTRQVIVGTVDLPPRSKTNAETGEVTFEPRKLGPSSYVSLQWGPYFQPTLEDVNKAVQAAASAKKETLVDEEAATRFVASYFGIDDVAAALHKIKLKAEADAKAMQDMAREQMALTAEMEAGAAGAPPPEPDAFDEGDAGDDLGAAEGEELPEDQLSPDELGDEEGAVP